MVWLAFDTINTEEENSYCAWQGAGVVFIVKNRNIIKHWTFIGRPQEISRLYCFKFEASENLPLAGFLTFDIHAETNRMTTTNEAFILFE